MTKFLLALLLTLLFAVTASPQRKLTDLEKESLKGPVHFVTSESSSLLSVVGGREEKGRTTKLDSLTFDSQGLLVERVIYDDYGFLVGTEKYAHDNAAHLLTAELSDEKGRAREKRALSYSPQGRLLEIIFYDAKAIATLKQVYLYDDAGRLTAEVYYDPKNAVGRTAFQTDERGHSVAAAFFLADGGKAVAPIGPCYNVHRVEYAYDGEGRVVAESGFEPNGSVKRKSTYRYDEKGNIVEEVRTNSLSTLKYVHSYEYDSQGNWISHTIRTHARREPLLPGDKPDESDRTTIRTRKITYFLSAAKTDVLTYPETYPESFAFLSRKALPHLPGKALPQK